VISYSSLISGYAKAEFFFFGKAAFFAENNCETSKRNTLGGYQHMWILHILVLENERKGDSA